MCRGACWCGAGTHSRDSRGEPSSIVLSHISSYRYSSLSIEDIGGELSSAHRDEVSGVW